MGNYSQKLFNSAVIPKMLLTSARKKTHHLSDLKCLNCVNKLN